MTHVTLSLSHSHNIIYVLHTIVHHQTIAPTCLFGRNMKIKKRKHSPHHHHWLTKLTPPHTRCLDNMIFRFLRFHWETKSFKKGKDTNKQCVTDVHTCHCSSHVRSHKKKCHLSYHHKWGHSHQRWILKLLSSTMIRLYYCMTWYLWSMSTQWNAIENWIDVIIQCNKKDSYY